MVAICASAREGVVIGRRNVGFGSEANMRSKPKQKIALAFRFAPKVGHFYQSTLKPGHVSTCQPI
jgi:hypothetical protein